MAMFFESGRDALSVVAENNGMWNWCFIGPDSAKLPLVAGGSGSVEDMRACLASHTEHAVIFGLLRLSFGAGKMRRSKFVFIVASNEEVEVPKTAVATGRAMSQRGALEKEIQSYVLISVTVEVKRASDLTLESIVDGVSKKVIIDGAHNREKNASPDDAGASFNSSAIADAMAEERAAKEAAASQAHDDSPPQSEAGDDAADVEADLEQDEELKQEVQAMAHEFHRAATGLGGGPAAAAAAESPPALAAVAEDDAAVPGAGAEDLLWSEERCAPLEGESHDEGRYASKEMLLDKSTFDSVAKAVEALNAGAVTAPAGYCVVMTPEPQFFLLYQKGSEEQPLSFKFAGLLAATTEASGAKKKLQCPGGHELKEISGNKGACDICNAEFGESVTVMGCPICNWAACVRCYGGEPKAAGGDSLAVQPPEEPPPLSGLILKQATNFFAEWQLRSFEVSRGKIRYWPDHASRNAGYRPKYEYSLLNATVALIKSSDSRFQLTLKGSKAMERAPYLLMANIAAVATPEEAKFRHSREDWVLALVQHTVYAKKDLAFRRAAAVVQRSLA